MADELRHALNDVIGDELDAAFSRVEHCVNQLTEEQVWSRPRSDMNSIANLILHLAGNVRQLIGTGVGGALDVRDRPAEFATREPIAKAELLRRLGDAVRQAKAAVAAASVEVLCNPIPVKKYDYTGLQAVIRSVAHFRGHTQEIIHMTRMILGDQYQFAGPK